jgi:hypothetical protein
MQVFTKDISDLASGTFEFQGETFTFERANSQRHEASIPPVKSAVHWSAGNPKTVYDDYTFCITEVNKKIFIFKCLKWSEKGQHLWLRNSGTLGFSMLCFAKDEATMPTKDQIEYTALAIAEVYAWKKIDPRGKVSTYKISQGKVIPGSNLEVDTISDHMSYAKSDGYYPDRVDVGVYLKPIRDRAVAIFDELKTPGKRKFQLLSLLESA